MMRDEFAYQDVGLEGFALGLTFYQFESIRFHQNAILKSIDVIGE